MDRNARVLGSALATLLLALACGGLALACGGGDSGGPTGPGNNPPGGDPPGGGGDPPGGKNPQGTIVVLPATLTMYEGDSYVFEAVLDSVDATDLNWSATNGAVVGNGAIVTYTAPLAAGVHVLTARSTSGAAPASSATIVVEPAIPGGFPGPNGAAVIDQALDAGTIDVSTATLYKAWWAFRDEQLPAQYRGSPAGWRGHVPDEVFSPPNGVSAEVLAQLAPYKLPPDAEGSWYLAAEAAAQASAQAAALASVSPLTADDRPLGSPIHLPPPEPVIPGPRFLGVDAPSGDFRIIWDTRRPGDAARAEVLAGEMDRVWTRLRDEFGVTPTSAASGGTIYDVFLVPMDWTVGGEAIPEGVGTSVLDGPQCPAQSSHLLLNRNLSGQPLRSAFTHELMHVFLWALPVSEGCANDAWFTEATSVWAETFFYPQLVEPPATRDAYLLDFTDYHDQPMHSWSVSNDGVHTGFGAYPFFVYLERFRGAGQVFEAIRQSRLQHVYLAMEQAFAPNFADYFADFALESWGEEPYRALLSWLGATETTSRNVQGIELPPGAQGASFGPEGGLTVAPASFQNWWMPIGPSNPASVRINNPFSGLLDGEFANAVRVYVLYRHSDVGVWSMEEVTDTEGVTFCRANPGEVYDEFALVISNAVWHTPTPVTETPLAEAFSACFEWQGSVWLDYSFESQITNLVYFDIDMDATDLVFESGSEQGGGIGLPVPRAPRDAPGDVVFLPAPGSLAPGSARAAPAGPLPTNGVQRFNLKSGSMTAQVEEGSLETEGMLTRICKYGSNVMFALEDFGDGYLEFPSNPAPEDPLLHFGSGAVQFATNLFKLTQACTREEPVYQISIEWLRTSPQMEWAESEGPPALIGSWESQQIVIAGAIPYLERWEWRWQLHLTDGAGGG